MPTVSNHGSLRYADGQTAGKFPLPCADQLPWTLSDDSAVCRIHLDHVPAQSIVIPSLAVLGTDDYAYQVALSHDGAVWQLPPVPNPNAHQPPQPEGSQISTHIDCFHVHEPLSGLTLEFRVQCGGIPQQFLLSASWRPLQLDDPPGPQTSVCGTPPPAISQMSQGGSSGSVICSPACLAMVLRGFDASVELPAIVEECYDPASKIYGVWPNAVRAAARRGVIAATQAFAGWADAEQVLDQGYPLIASIRFAAGRLPGAPLAKTAGHLVVVHGASPECVVTNDPAAPEVATVPRTYEAGAFTQAWLSHRGAAYILVP